MESGLPSDIGDTLILPSNVLLACMHTTSVDRALRLFEVCIAHDAVEVLVAPKFDKTFMGQRPQAQVYHICIDWNQALWLRHLKSSCVGDIATALPFNDTLKMCYGKPIPVDDIVSVNMEADNVLHWYNPSSLRTTEEDVGFANSKDPKLLLAWQFRPNAQQYCSVGGSTTRKRKQRTYDLSDVQYVSGRAAAAA